MQRRTEMAFSMTAIIIRCALVFSCAALVTFCAADAFAQSRTMMPKSVNRTIEIPKATRSFDSNNEDIPELFSNNRKERRSARRDRRRDREQPVNVNEEDRTASQQKLTDGEQRKRGRRHSAPPRGQRNAEPLVNTSESGVNN